MEDFFNIKNLISEAEDGADYTEILQKAIDKNEKVFIPDGFYTISKTLQIPSHRYIKADKNARVKYIAPAKMTRYDFLMSNSDTVIGNEDITIDGGIWDGGNDEPFNKKRPDLFTVSGCCGACLNFVGIRNLKLINLEITNTIAFYIRISRVRNFEIRNITFSGERLTTNQDGVHMGGDVYDGIIENVRVSTYGQTGDDLLAFNADDSVIRHDNRGLTCGPIENITVRNVFAECCHCAIRFCSVVSPIRHIRITNLEAGCWSNGINVDAARYCRTPLFPERETPLGVGCLEDIVIDGFKFYYTKETQNPVFVLEEHADKVEIKNYVRIKEKDKAPEAPDLHARNLTRQIIRVNGEEHVLLSKEDTFVCSSYTNLSLDYAFEEK